MPEPALRTVIAGYARTAFHPARKGQLVGVRPDQLAAAPLRHLIEQSAIDPAQIEDVIMGCAFPEAEQGFNIGRLAVFMAGLPETTAGMTVNRFCGSSMQSAHIAAGAIALGSGRAFLAAGVESMSRVPIEGFNPMPSPDVVELSPDAYCPMGTTAENVAKAHDISRKDQEEFALLSHQKAVAAQKAGKFKAEIVPLAGVEADGCIRPETSLDGLAGLNPAFEAKGTVTAGTSSPLTDGGAAVLVLEESFAKEQNCKPLARIRSTAVAGCAPGIMGMGPVPASNKALKRAGLGISDMDIIEINEAFAAQALACLRALEADMEQVNLDGGALALGHPLGATGARILGKAAALLQREGKQFALVTQCIGGGQGIATVLEAV